MIRISSLRPFSSNVNIARIKEISLQKASLLSKFFDDLLGVSDVVQAQKDVQAKEIEFLRSRRELQETKDLLSEKSQELRDTRKKLDRCSRDDEYYLTYVSEEHQLLLEEKDLRVQYERKEGRERDLFTDYASSVRVSHEQERVRAERTKYWSIIGSISGTILGFLLSSGATYYRFKKIREISTDGGTTNLLQELKDDFEQQSIHSTQLQESLTATAKFVAHEFEEQRKLLNTTFKRTPHLPTKEGSNYNDALVSMESLQEIQRRVENLAEELSKGISNLERLVNLEVSDLNSSLDNRLTIRAKVENPQDSDGSDVFRNITIVEDDDRAVLSVGSPSMYEGYWLQKANLAVGVTGIILIFYSVFLRGS